MTTMLMMVAVGLNAVICVVANDPPSNTQIKVSGVSWGMFRGLGGVFGG